VGVVTLEGITSDLRFESHQARAVHTVSEEENAATISEGKEGDYSWKVPSQTISDYL
jgi:hypothetical protein